MSASVALHEQLQKMQAKRKSQGSQTGSDDGDTASQLSISLSSAPPSPPPPAASPLPKSPPPTSRSTTGHFQHVPETPPTPMPAPAPAPVPAVANAEPIEDLQQQHELALSDRSTPSSAPILSCIWDSYTRSQAAPRMLPDGIAISGAVIPFSAHSFCNIRALVGASTASI